MAVRDIRTGDQYIVFMTVYVTVFQVATIISFHPMLPFFLRDVHPFYASMDNTTDPAALEKAEASIAHQIGISLGTSQLTMALASFISAAVIQRVGLWNVSLLAGILSILSPLCALFADGFWTIAIANSFICIGQTITSIFLMSTFNKRAQSQTYVSRMNGLYQASISIGNIIGYFCTGLIYELSGHATVYGIYTGLLTIGLLIRLLWVEPIDSKSNVNERKDATTVSTKDTKTTKQSQSSRRIWWRFFTDCHIIILIFQVALLFTVVAMYVTGAPNYAASVLGATAWQIGCISGIGSAVDAVLASTSSLFMTTHRRRCVCFVIVCATGSCGFFWYMLCTDIWQTLLSDILIRSFKSITCIVIMSLCGYVSQCKKLEYNGEMGGLVYNAGGAAGYVIGAYATGALVPLIDVFWLYMVLGIVTLLLLLTQYPLWRLTSTEIVIYSQSCVNEEGTERINQESSNVENIEV